MKLKLKKSILTFVVALVLAGAAALHSADVQIPGWLTAGSGTIDTNTLRFTLATDDPLIKLEDSVHVSGDTGVMLLVVRQDVPAALAGTNLDYAPLQVDALGGLWLAGAFREDTGASSGDRGVNIFGRINTGVVTQAANSDYTSMALGTAGTVLMMPVYDNSVADNVKTVEREDNAFTTGDAGQKILVVRDDVLEAGAAVTTDLDYTVLRVDNFGSAWSALTADDGARIPADSTTGLLVNTELPAAATLSDAIANPTTPMIGAAMMLFNPCGGTWERAATNGSGLQEIVIASGNNIAITSIVPTSSALALGKAEDFGSLGTDVGVAAMTIRDDVLEADAAVSADLDYTWTRVDNFGSAWSALTADDGARIPASSTTGLLVNTQITDPQRELHAAASSTGDGTTIDVSGATSVLIHTTTDGSWDRTATLTFQGAMGGGALSAFRQLPYYEFQNPSSATNPVYRSAFSSLSLAATASDQRGFLVDVTGFQSLKVPLSISGGSAGTVEVHAHVVYNGGRVHNGAANLASSLTGLSGIPEFVSMIGGLNTLNQVRHLPVYDEDAASANGDNLLPIAAIRDDSLSAGAGVNADGDYVQVRLDNFGALWNTATDGAGNVLAQIEDVGHVSGDPGIMTLGVNNDVGAVLAVGVGDYTPLSVTRRGFPMSMPVVDQSVAQSIQIGKLEDNAHASNDAGMFVLAIRNDDLGTLLGNTNGDYTGIAVTQNGAIYIAGSQIEDIAHVTGDDGVLALGIMNEGFSTFGTVDGDYTGIATDRFLHLINAPVHSTGIAATLQLSKREDNPSANSDAGVPAITVRDDALAANADTTADGDYTFTRVDNFGALWNTATDGAGNILAQLVDSVGGSTDGGITLLALRDDVLTTLTPVDGDYVRLRVNSTGQLHVTSAAGVTEFNIGTVAGATDAGNVGLLIRDDVLTTLVDADGDYVTGRVDSIGGLWIAGSQIEDVAHVTGDRGVLALGIANTSTQVRGADGDYIGIAVTTQGAILSAGYVDQTLSDARTVNKTEDQASAGGAGGTAIFAIRDDTLTAGALVGLDGDYTHIRVDNFGAAWTTATDGAGNVLAKAEDSAHVSGDSGIMALAVINSSLSIPAAGGDYVPLQLTGGGFLATIMVYDATIPSNTRVVQREDNASAAFDAGIVTLIVRDDALTAGAGAQDGDYINFRADNLGALWIAGSQIEDVLAVTGERGVGALGVVNGALASKAADGDYTFTALSVAGAVLGIPVYEASIGATVRATDLEDQAPGAGHAGLVVLHERDDVLAANAGVSTDGDLVYPKADNFGALWTREHNVVQELGITELIGINEQVDASEYGASVTTSLAGSGTITKVCLIATEDGSGAILTPAGTLIIFDADPATVAGDVSITAGERLTVLAQLDFASVDYQSDANGASNCQATTEIFHTGTLFSTWFLNAAETSFNDVAGDDEQLELNIWFTQNSG